MEISPINLQYNSYKRNPSFGTIATGKGVSAIRPDLRMNFSHFFRCLCDKEEKIKHLEELIKMSDKPVELLYCGCSDGTAVFDDLMYIIKSGIPLEKIKINAFDISKDVIEIAKSGRINISNSEIAHIYTLYPGNDFWVRELPLLEIPNNDIEFIENSLKTKYQHSYQFNPEFLKHINFYQSDLFTELGKRTADTDRIISCENLAVYLKKGEPKQAARMFYNIMKPHSLITVGARDEYCDIITTKEFLSKKPQLEEKILSNLTDTQRKYYKAAGEIATPNTLVTTLGELGLKHNTKVSECGCAYEKLPMPKLENYYIITKR